MGFPIMERSFHDIKNTLAAFTLKQFSDTSFNAASFVNLQTWAKEFNDDKYGRDPEKLNGGGPINEDWVNVGCYRVMVHDRNSMGMNISPGKHGRLIREKYFANSP